MGKISKINLSFIYFSRFQMRHSGADYKGIHHDYTNQGVDQLMDVINQIKTNPNSRRMIISLWNPSDLKKVVLPW